MDNVDNDFISVLSVERKEEGKITTVSRDQYQILFMSGINRI